MTKKSVTLSLPDLSSISKKISGKNYAPLLVVLLIVAAFLLGVLFTKVQYLEKGVGTSGSGNLAENTDDFDFDQPTGPVDVSVGNLPVLGDENAPVTIVEFSDFQCQFCRNLWEETLPQIKREYIDTGKVRFAYRHFPLDFHQNAQKAAEASECANEQGKFWDYHDELFRNQSEWEGQPAQDALNSFVKYAEAVRINGSSLRSCVESDKYAQAIRDDYDAGVAAGVNGTPATYVNGLLISGAQPYSAFKTIIDQELEK